MKDRTMMRPRLVNTFAALALLYASAASMGNDWPTYRHDPSRSGVTTRRLGLPLTEVWVHKSKHAPRPAWPPPAKQDFWHRHRQLQPAVTYDRAFHVAAADGSVFYGSSAEDKVYCLDGTTGSVRWMFFTEGPVRLAPTVSGNRVYLGSDDGCVYCLNAKDGGLVWKRRLAPDDRRIPGNGRMISVWPVRTGVVIYGGVAYCCAGLFPNEGVYVAALDATDGSVVWMRRTDRAAPQGYLLASESYLFVPTGRTAPAVFNRRDGTYLGEFGVQGGAFALVTDGALVSGPGRTTGQVEVADVKTRERLASFDGLHMIVDLGIAYLHSENSIAALDHVRYLKLTKERNALAKRKGELEKALATAKAGGDSKQAKALGGLLSEVSERSKAIPAAMRECFLWRRPCLNPYSLILAGDTLFAGGDNSVAAFAAEDGKELWTAPVEGRAYGLAVAENRLMVSTDNGAIHCFAQSTKRTSTLLPSDSKSDLSPVRPSQGASPYPEDELSALYARAASRIVALSGVKKGYCLDLGCGEGRLAYEIAKRTELKIIGVDEDPGRVAAAREALDQAGVYGVQAVVHQGSLSDLPYATFFANLIVSDRAIVSKKLPGDIAEVIRLLRPSGGVLCVGQPEGKIPSDKRLTRSEMDRWRENSPGVEWQTRENEGLWIVARRRHLSGSGEWTHLYADAGNTSCSGDRLQSPMQVQWFGRPGPRNMVDRHHRAMGPLVKDGRLFITGNNRVLAVDAFNGALLWDVEVPNARRVGAARDCGHVVATSDYLYAAAGGKCLGLDVETGEASLVFDVPDGDDGVKRWWGYVATVGDFLFGSGEKKGASRTGHSRGAIVEGTYFDNRPIVTSDMFFCLDRDTGERVWEYKRKGGGAIVNSAIAVGGGHVYFIESNNPEALADGDGRITLEVLLAKGRAYLVKLDQRTGEKLWERSVDLSSLRHVLFLSYARGTVVVVGSRNESSHPRYDLHGFDAGDGSPLWSNHYVRTDKPVNGDHGEQDQHPVIIGNTVYSRPYAFDLKTGEKRTFNLDRGGHGCGGLSASASYLYGRGGNPRMYPLSEGGKANIALTRVSRPGCWINIIPAGGLVLIPEGSSGCTCAYPLQTSIGLAPREPGASATEADALP